MAETTFVIGLIAGAVNPAEILTPLSPMARTVGTVLGCLVSLAGCWLALAHWFHIRQAGAESIVLGLRWRIPIALVIVVTGLLIILGSRTNPVTDQRAFIVLWVLVLMLTGLALVFAGVDAWYVGQRATKRRLELIHQKRQMIKREIELLRSQHDAPPTQGDPLNN